MDSKQTIIIPQEFDGVRLDKAMGKLADIPFFVCQVMCRKGKIKVDGKRCKPDKRVNEGQEVTLFQQEQSSVEKPAKKTVQFSNKDLKWIEPAILYEDKNMVAINKPTGIPTQAGTGHQKSIDRLMEAYYGPKALPKLVHRLDKATTGVLVLAKGRKNAAELTRQFRSRGMEKIYWAVVKGKLKKKEGKIDLSLEKTGPEGAEKVSSLPQGKKALTYYKALASAGDIHLLEVHPKTGRMHQIRAHFSAIGVPIVGDRKYGGEDVNFDNVVVPKGAIFLHARQLSLKDDKGIKRIIAPAPKHFTDVFALFGWGEKDF